MASHIPPLAYLAVLTIDTIHWVVGITKLYNTFTPDELGAYLLMSVIWSFLISLVLTPLVYQLLRDANFEVSSRLDTLIVLGMIILFGWGGSILGRSNPSSGLFQFTIWLQLAEALFFCMFYTLDCC